MSWRPENWKPIVVITTPERRGGKVQRSIVQAYEAGADAMLEALRTEYPQTHISEIELKGGNRINGKWVFIPNDIQPDYGEPSENHLGEPCPCRVAYLLCQESSGCGNCKIKKEEPK